MQPFKNNFLFGKLQSCSHNIPISPQLAWFVHILLGSDTVVCSKNQGYYQLALCIATCFYNLHFNAATTVLEGLQLYLTFLHVLNEKLTGIHTCIRS